MQNVYTGMNPCVPRVGLQPFTTGPNRRAAQLAQPTSLVHDDRSQSIAYLTFITRQHARLSWPISSVSTTRLTSFTSTLGENQHGITIRLVFRTWTPPGSRALPVGAASRALHCCSNVHIGLGEHVGLGACGGDGLGEPRRVWAGMTVAHVV